MTSLLDAPVLAALPRVRLVPAAADSEGDLACDLSAGYGLIPFAWQRSALIDILGVRPDGRWAASRVGLSVPRQNGKNACAEIYELWVTSQLGMRVLHSAHEVKTARKAFKRLLGFYDNPRQYPELRDLVKDVRRTNGQEAVELHNGGSVEFIARTKSSGRGYSADILLLDEAQELTDEELEAIQPTISASANPQAFLMGTPPPEEKPATVWRRFRAAGLEGRDPKLCWIEYGAAPDEDHTARSAWASANPGAPESIGWEAIEDDRAAMSVEGFARERLGVWTERGSASLIPAPVWAACSDSSSQIEGPPTFAVAVSNDRSWSCIAAAGTRSDGLRHVEVIENRRGTAWVAARCAELVATWGGDVFLNPSSPAASLKQDLDDAGVAYREVTANEMNQACGLLYDEVVEGVLRHLDQQVLNLAVAQAVTRPSGDGAWVWSQSKSPVDISPLIAVTLAGWACAESLSSPSVFFA